MESDWIESSVQLGMVELSKAQDGADSSNSPRSQALSRMNTGSAGFRYFSRKVYTRCQYSLWAFAEFKGEPYDCFSGYEWGVGIQAFKAKDRDGHTDANGTRAILTIGLIPFERVGFLVGGRLGSANANLPNIESNTALEPQFKTVRGRTYGTEISLYFCILTSKTFELRLGAFAGTDVLVLENDPDYELTGHGGSLDIRIAL